MIFDQEKANLKLSLMSLDDKWNNKSYMGCLFVNFETIDHDTLLLKLALYGLGIIPWKWFLDDNKERKQHIIDQKIGQCYCTQEAFCH